MLRRSPLLDFMEDHYEILPPAPILGKFKIENSPWLAEPMHAICDPKVREVTTMFAAQGGKNLITEGFISYSILHAPGNVLFYGQTDEDAEMFATSKALKRAREIEVLKHIWPDTKGAKKNNQVHLGHLVLEFLGASKSNIEGKTAPYIICDEKHLPQWKGLSKIVKERCSAFWDSKVINISTAGEEGSEIDLDFRRGTMEDWHLGCPACHRLVKLVWSDEAKTIVWSAKDEEGEKRMHPAKGTWNFREVRKNTRFKCPHPGCNCEEKDSTPLKKEMNRLGAYIAENPEAPEENRSFHASQMAYPWKQWEELAENWIQACERAKTGNLSDLKSFVIRSMGHTWENRVSNTSTAHVTGDYMIVGMERFIWEDEKDRFATVDVQERGGRHFWVTVRAWAAGGRSRLINAYRCESWDEVSDRIDENHVKARRVGVDSRHATEEVKEMCAAKGWFFMIADAGDKEYATRLPSGIVIRRPYMQQRWHDTRQTHDPRNPAGRKPQFAAGYTFSKDWARSVLANRISGLGAEWGLPSDVGSLVFKGTAKIQSSYLGQINSWVEKDVVDKKTNEIKKQWVQINTDDHLRACEEMQIVLAAISGFVPSELGHPKTD